MNFVEAVRRESEDFAAAVSDLEAPVPSCPGWTAADLVYHLGEVQYFWERVVSGPLVTYDEARAVPDPERPPDDKLVSWFRQGANRLVDTLAGADPDLPCWNWSSVVPDTAAFVPRRMAHEASVHRWDAQAAAERPLPIDSELAADGVDEFFFVHLPEEETSPPAPGKSVHLHRTDGPGEWLVRMEADGASISLDHVKGDAAVRAGASDLVLMLWRRVPPEAGDPFGDRGVLDSFLSWIDLT